MYGEAYSSRMFLTVLESPKQPSEGSYSGRPGPFVLIWKGAGSMWSLAPDSCSVNAEETQYMYRARIMDNIKDDLLEFSFASSPVSLCPHEFRSPCASRQGGIRRQS